MAKLFGTDGVRGEAGVDLTPDLAYKLGCAAGTVLLRERQGEAKTVVIGRDGRISGHMLEAGLTAGLTAVGINVISVGIIPTPGVAWLVRDYRALAGVVISASHNPYWDNGIKFFNAQGQKLSDEQEEAIEQLVEDDTSIVFATGGDIGQLMQDNDGIERYGLFLNEKAIADRFNFRVVVDCANGAASPLVEKLFKDLGLRCRVISNTPNGCNINKNCGSTDMARLIEEVRLWDADIGFAYDGDADRFLAVDEDGTVVDGDHLLGIYARYLKENDELLNNTLVLTVMSNLGLKLAMKNLGIDVYETKVGDRYVNEGLLAKNAILGGEQSGHIIFRQHNTTGDGLLSSIMLLNIMHQSKKSLKELAEVMTALPQELINVRVRDKNNWQEVPAIRESIAAVEQRLGETGRVLVRASGTEPLLRVMVEGPDIEATVTAAKEISDVVRDELGI